MEMKEMVYKPIRDYEILCAGKFKGLNFYIISYGTHPCAYVECPFDDMTTYKDSRLYEINVHCGFTFFGKRADSKTKNYLGWDYHHLGDFDGYSLNPDYTTFCEPYDKEWTTQEIYDEVEYVINQLLEIKE